MLVIFVVPLLIFSAIKKLFFKTQRKSIKSRHIVITGGSSGIGKSVAKLAAKQGANVTIIARNPERLADAIDEIKPERISPDQTIRQCILDVSNKDLVTKELRRIDDEDPIFMLVNCAGVAICGTVEELTEAQVRTLLDANYLGTLYPIQALVPAFKRRKEGIIVLTSSTVGLMGMFGYSVYSSCKFALRGLAESIAMELKPFGVSVTVCLPPDTDTPGFEAENLTKPEETKLISEAGGLVQPEKVAQQLLDDSLDEKFFSWVGIEGYIITTLCVGMSTFSSITELLIQSLILGPLRLIGAYYCNTFTKIVQKCHLARNHQ